MKATSPTCSAVVPLTSSPSAASAIAVPGRPGAPKVSARQAAPWEWVYLILNPWMDSVLFGGSGR